MTDIDIPALIERAKARVAELDKLASFVSNMNRPRSDNAHGRDAAIIEELAEALSRLSVSPLPEEIADLCGRLRGVAHVRIAEWQRLRVNTDMVAEGLCEWEAAAALERMARENAHLRLRIVELDTELEDCNGVHQRAQVAEAHIRELEAESHEANTACDAQIRRANRAEAERDRCRETNTVLMGQWEDACRERDAIQPSCQNTSPGDMVAWSQPTSSR